MQAAAVGEVVRAVRPAPAAVLGRCLHRAGQVAPLLATAIPLGIYNFTEAMNNVESASAAGDNYNLRKILLADGLGAIVGSMLGSPFPPAVYIGHPGWKAVGGRIGYSLATGIAIALVCFLGLTALLLAVIPLVAILPILLYIGLVIGAQAFQASPPKHAPAVVLAIIPNIAEWAQDAVDGALGAAGTSVARRRPGQARRHRRASTTACELARRRLGARRHGARRDRGLHHRQQAAAHAAAWAFAGAVLSYIGLIHGAQLGWARVAAGRARLRDVRRGVPGLRRAEGGARLAAADQPSRIRAVSLARVTPAGCPASLMIFPQLAISLWTNLPSSSRVHRRHVGGEAGELLLHLRLRDALHA